MNIEVLLDAALCGMVNRCRHFGKIVFP